MPQAPRSTVDQLEQLKGDLHDVVAQLYVPSRSHRRAEQLIAEVERIAAGMRTAVRGGIR